MFRKTLCFICMLGLPLAACDPVTPPTEPFQPVEVLPVLEGVWQRAEVVLDSGPDAGPHLIDVQPSIYIFSKSHYGISAAEGFRPRPSLGEDPTDAELGQAFVPYTAETGAYTVADNKLTLVPLVTKDPAEMDGVVAREFDITWDGIDVWLAAPQAEGGFSRTRLTRVDADERLATEAALRLVGVWRRAEMIVGAGPDAGRHLEDAQPGLYIFTPRAFVGNYVSAFAPRPLLTKTPTDEAMGRNYRSFVSFGGKFTLRDDVLVLSAISSQNPNNMRGRPFQSIDVTWEGEDVWFIYTNAEGVQNRTRLVRVPD
jgi:hypothetical protein